VIQKHGECGNLSLKFHNGKILWLCKEHQRVIEAETESRAIAAERRLGKLWSNYRQRLFDKVSQVRLLGETESRELKQVFVELSISEDYQRPSARNEWMGFVDAELRKRRSIFVDSSDDQLEKKMVRPDDLSLDRTRAIITGAPGCGKSTLLRWLTGKIL